MTKMQRSLVVTSIGLGMTALERLALMGGHPLIGKHSSVGLSLLVLLLGLGGGIICFVGGIQGIIAGGGLRAILGTYKKRV